MTAQFSGAGSVIEEVALESVDWPRLSRVPRMKFKCLLSGWPRVPTWTARADNGLRVEPSVIFRRSGHGADVARLATG